MDKKTELRTRAKELRKNLDTTEISLLLCEKIRKNEVYKSSKNVMIFYPKKYEIDLRTLFSDNKNFYLPRVNRQNLEVCPYKVGDILRTSDFGVLEPTTPKESPKMLDLIIVPALMADKQGYRLGYGGGYYDRFLNENRQIKTICAIPEIMLIQDLPHDENDIKIDFIIT